MVLSIFPHQVTIPLLFGNILQTKNVFTLWHTGPLICTLRVKKCLWVHPAAVPQAQREGIILRKLACMLLLSRPQVRFGTNTSCLGFRNWSLWVCATLSALSSKRLPSPAPCPEAWCRRAPVGKLRYDQTRSFTLLFFFMQLFQY